MAIRPKSLGRAGNTGAPAYFYQVHIADGYADDCENIVQRYLSQETHTYEMFCEIWKDLNFGSLYSGRVVGAEIAELSEEVLHIAKRYMVANTSNVEESVAGLFLVYGLLRLQPFTMHFSLRIVREDLPALIQIDAMARRENRHDVLFVMGSLFIQGPVQFHIDARERGLESSLRKYFEGYTTIDALGIRPKGVFYRQTEELDLIRELNNLTTQYTRVKATVQDENGRMDRNLNYTDKNLLGDFETSLKKLICGQIEDDKSNKEVTVDHSTVVQEIKRRAMKHVIDPLKHLSGVNERKRKSNTSTKEKPAIRAKPGKVKSGSPKKPIATSIRKASKTKPKDKAKKKRRKRKKSTSSESDNSISEVDDLFLYSERESEDDLNIEDFQKDKVIEIGDQTTENQEDLQEINIHIDTVPVVIRSTQNQMFEVEIIDQYQGSPDMAEDTESKINALPGISLTRITRASTSNETSDINIAGASEVKTGDASKKPNECHVLRKRDKRELKNRTLKSKFKKMGLESVANFQNERQCSL